MNKLAISLLMLVVIVSLSFAVISINNTSENKIKNTQEAKILNFSTFTSAVCQNKNDLVDCKDEVFIKCNGKISRAADVTECNGIKINAPTITGAAVFDKNWKDPRG